MPFVLIPAPYRGPTGGLDRIETRGATIGACLDEVEARHPGLRALVLDSATGQIHRFVKLFVNGELQGRESAVLERPIGSADEIEILSAIAGG